MALVEVKVPDIGDFKDVEIIELLVAPGDTVRAEQSLLTVESDKASMEIPSSHAGVVKEMRVKLGDKVNQGVPVMLIETGEVGAAAAPETAAPAAQSAPVNAVAPPVQVASATSVELRIPDIGDFDEVAVIEVFIKPGDTVKAEQSLITVESDKASMEIPSSHTGVVTEVRVKLGDKVAKGSVVALMDAIGAVQSPPVSSTTAGSAQPVIAAQAPSGTSSARAAVPAAAPDAATAPSQLPHASPTIRKLARELGVPLAEVAGSGPKGRITQEDVQGFVKQVMAGATKTHAQSAKAPTNAASGGAFPGLLPWPQVDFSKFGPVQRKDLSRIKKISGANLHRNWLSIPHVTNHDDADITELEAFRVQLNKENDSAGIKITMLAFLIKASVAALKKFPEFNASLDGEQLVLKQYFHIGFAADTPSGLMVPVIKDADTKGVLQLSADLSELSKKAREGKLSPGEMSGGCFSISSLGGIGGRYFTPIINAPEVAILGVCRSATEPRWDGKAFVPRLMLPLSLAWDHRVIDGAAAARFNAYLGSVLADFRRVLL